MKHLLFKISVSILILSGILLFTPVQAEESPTSTPEISTITPTSTPEIITTTSTSEMSEEISTSTEEIISPTTPEIETTTTTIDTSTTTPEIETTTTTESIILPTSTIHIQIETFDGNLFSNYFTFTACSSTEDGSEYTLNAWCAIQQLAETQNWTIEYSWGDYGLYLSKINQYDGSDYNWWGWYSELEMGMTSLNNHLTTENENILLTYAVSPLKIDISNLEPKMNSTITIQIQEFGFDENWNSIWLDSVSSTLVINNEEFMTNNGSYELLITTTTPYEIYGKKNGFINTKINTIYPQENKKENNNSSSNSNEIQNVLISNDKINNTSSKILDYLRLQQDETGMIADGTITDWIIMSFASQGIYADDIKNNGDSLLDYEKKYNLDDNSDLNVCASYPRHILALLSAGVGKNDEAILGLKNKVMNECYENNLYGQNGINDDVFGLISLLAIDVDKNEIIIQDIINTIISDQNNDGAFTWSGWAGADMTGATINALQYAKNKNIEIDNNIFTNAKNYLKSQQLADGGWGYGTSDTMTTSWVLMGINALGESQSDWFNSVGKNPWHPFIEQMNENGFYESAWVPGTVDWFAMKHVVPALLGKSWPIILPEKVQNFSSGGGLNYIYSTTDENISIEEITTSTPDITTTTLDIATTTLDITTTTLEIATTTIEILEIPTSTENILISNNENNSTDNNPPPTTTNNNPVTKNQKKVLPEIIVEQISSTSSNDNIITFPSSTIENNAGEIAKKMFTTSAGMSGSLLIYLIWKIVKNLI